MNNLPFLSSNTADSIRVAAEALKAGHLVAFPTETVYGLGGDARNPEAVKRIYEVKGRPSDHPLIVHISSMNKLDKWASEIPDYAIALARAFWPGPMTLILNRTEVAKDFITGGQETVGLRVPSDPIALALMQEFERISDSAIAAPSANRFGQVSATCSNDVLEELEEYLSYDDIVLDGGISKIGIESTIIDCTGETPRILRPGFIGETDIELITGLVCQHKDVLKLVKFSGSFEKHYAPKCRIILGMQTVEGGGLLALAEVDTPSEMIRIGQPSTSEEFARILYSSFRTADRKNLGTLVVVPPNGPGLALAIAERLSKASQGR